VPSWKRSRSAPGGEAGGETVTGYHDLQRVVRGGFSVVYRARQDQLDRVVALKVLAMEFIDAAARKRFLRELRLTSRLTGHPHVVTVLDSGMTTSGRPYIAMEFFERGSLRDRRACSSGCPATTCARWPSTSARSRTS
jgi:serine/threonine-protein kinase PknK